MNNYICMHRERTTKMHKCKFYTQCCDKFYYCIKCHNDNQTHICPPKSITHISCDLCDTMQQISQMCIKCDTLFAHYYCDICKIYSQEDAFHCDKCNACMIGKSYDYKHCKKCNCCISRQKYDQHICLENRLDDNCSICLLSLKSELKTVILKCGHSLHEKCKNELLKDHSKCPICMMTLKDMTNEYKQIDEQIARSSYKNFKIVQIYCNDCMKHSNNKYHPIGTRCIKCYSYNTTIC
jgi:RING finger/CHY zinc finger protein 1